VPAVLKRPHPFAAHSASPLQHLITPARTDPNAPLAEHLTRPGAHRGDAVELLCPSAPSTIMSRPPSSRG
jgi:hypothetical protein